MFFFYTTTLSQSGDRMGYSPQLSSSVRSEPTARSRWSPGMMQLQQMFLNQEVQVTATKTKAAMS